ncbi:uncharacterized protein [Macrobrachium rosenbergii]|uniref:uncharacterized protein n=1 Tax=Macrobrachium rosenbergii TaxID=79674 RepID=UPI0034D68E13
MHDAPGASDNQRDLTAREPRTQELFFHRPEQDIEPRVRDFLLSRIVLSSDKEGSSSPRDLVTARNHHHSGKWLKATLPSEQQVHFRNSVKGFQVRMLVYNVRSKQSQLRGNCRTAYILLLVSLSEFRFC